MHTKINRERLKVLRLSKSWTQQKLADNTNISLRSIQRIESDGVASLQSRRALANAFGIEPVDLEMDEIHRTSTLSIIVTLVLFTYSSFYMAIQLFDAPISELPAWALPLLPSMTMLIFGVILQAPLSAKMKRYFIIVGCLFLGTLLSPANPILQLAFTGALWAVFEILRLISEFMTQKGRLSPGIWR